MEEELTDEDVERRLIEKEIERKMLEIHGLIEKEGKEARNVLEPIICWRCKDKNRAIALYCDRCGAHLMGEKRCKRQDQV